MSGTIVCVDDQAEVRRLLAEVFKARGRDVQPFDDGEAAIAWLAAHEAEMVVLDLDLGMGKRTGIEICKSLRAAHPDLPIIILTGHGTIDDAVLAAVSYTHLSRVRATSATSRSPSRTASRRSSKIWCSRR